jgi:hypothetical protein
MAKKELTDTFESPPGNLRVLIGLLLGLGLVAILMNLRFGDRRTFYPVSGVVMVGGRPGAGIQIHLESDDRALETASGHIDESGKFTVYSGVQGHPGAMPGKYKIVFSQMGGSKLPVYRGDDAVTIPNTPPHTFPPAFLSANTSTLEVEVLPKDNEYKFDIEMPPGSIDAAADAAAATARRQRGPSMEERLKSRRPGGN